MVWGEGASTSCLALKVQQHEELLSNLCQAHVVVRGRVHPYRQNDVKVSTQFGQALSRDECQPEVKALLRKLHVFYQT